MGNEISKALEADALPVANGVVSEMSLGFKNDGKTDVVPVRRTAKDVAQRQQIFGFCSEWDLQKLSDFLRWYARFHSRAMTEKALDLRGLHEQVDALEQEIQIKQALLAQVEVELESLETSRQDTGTDTDPAIAKEQELVRMTLDSRRDDILNELHARQRALQDRKVHLLASVEGIDLTVEVKWPLFLKAVSQVQFHGTLHDKEESFAMCHPVAAGYAMARDGGAKKALGEFTKGDILLPPPANHEIDGHTDDSASDSAASEDNASSRDGDEESDASDAEDAELAAAPAEREVVDAVVTKPKGDDDDDDDDDDGDDNDDDGQATAAGQPLAAQQVAAVASEPTAPLTAEALADHTEQAAAASAFASPAPTLSYQEITKRPRVIKRPVPSAFDVATRSPVFFGYTLEKRADDVEHAITEDTSLALKETAIFDQKITHCNDQLQESIKTERGKLDAIAQRQADVLQKREKYWEKRHIEYERAKKELDPSDIFFRTREVQDKKSRDTQAFEDEEMKRQKEKVDQRIQVAQDTFTNSVDKIRRVRVVDEPLGDVRLHFHDAEIDMYHAQTLQAKVALTTAKEEYVALKGATAVKIGKQETKNRAQLLYAEDQIKAREKELEAVCLLYENELFLLKRAQDIYDREQLFLPFFACLQQKQQQQQSAHFKVVEMAIALLLGLGKVDLRGKVGFLFKMFSSRNRTPAIAVVHREAFAEILRLCLGLLAKLGDLHPRQELPREYVAGLADRAFLQLELETVDPRKSDPFAPRNGMTSIEFESYWTHLVVTNKFLCDLLGVPWKYDQLSRFVVQQMSAVHQYKLGLINVNDLKFAVARQAITARAELSRWKKDVIHERALAMGENDPLKTDYSKYLPKRRTKLLSKVVPLDHGGYRNLLVYRMEVIIRATTKLQTVWRARKGRQMARLAAEKQAFYHARGVALQEARQKIEQEWKEKDEKPAHTVEKMKFEAKIRMKQVKLRTKGNAFSRDQVMALLMEEAVQVSQKQVENRFREMEEELGYLVHDVALVKRHEDVEYLKDEISKALVSQVVQAKQETGDVAAVLDTIALTEELEAKKKKMKNQKTESQGQQPSTNQEQQLAMDVVVGGDRGETRDQHLENGEEKAARRARTELRQDQMQFGKFPKEIYTSGMTRDESLFEMTMAFPDPSLQALQARLQHICAGMTTFKMAEMLEELPSKRHICGYVTHFRRHDGSYDVEKLENDLVDHFRMVRGAKELAEALVEITETDLAFGLTQRVLRQVEEQHEGALTQLVAMESSGIADQNADQTAKKLVRMGYNALPPADDEGSNQEAATAAAPVVQGNPAVLLLQKEAHDLTEKKKRVQDAHTKFLDAMKAWKEAELSLHETQQSHLKVQKKYQILPIHRTKWAQRLSFAMALPDKDPRELQAKYTEVWTVCQDFLETSGVVARVLVRELQLPVAMKSILPVRASQVDGRQDDVRCVDRFKYEAHEILFTICTDDHGRFENSDENSAKYGGHAVRNCGLYHRALAGHHKNVVLPLECVVDFQGFRVLCSSKIPIEVVTWNEAGTSIQKATKQLVYGTENGGKNIIFQSKELDAMLAQAASQLNLSRHGVRGYHDLTSKFLHAPADTLGYLNSEKKLVVVNFARAMPPEDPEVATHLVASTRGMSILWRQLRPEFVANYSIPLSSDALSAMTYCAPDWQSQALGVEDATRHLVNVVIPGFAKKLSQKSDYFTNPTHFHLTKELHRHGINVRHLGLLRAQFLLALSGTATLQYATAEIQTTEDFTRQVDRGAPLYIQGKCYFVSRRARDRYDAQCLTLNEVYHGASMQQIQVFAGRQECEQNASEIRMVLLSEMVARAFKNLVRHWLRSAANGKQTGMTPVFHKQLLIHSLNLLTGGSNGSSSGGETFWKMHLYQAIRQRFGERAVSEVDQQNLRRHLLPQMAWIVGRVTEMMGFSLREACLERLKRHPDCHTFVLDDLESASPENGGGECLFRVKHNLSMLHFSMASLLLLQATVTQATSYKQLVTSDAPHGYWPLCERRGQLMASNLGSYGNQLAGKYLPGCLLEADGPIVNTDLNRAIEFHKENKSYVVFPFVQALYPCDATSHIALEAWCKCDGHSSTRRVVLTIGRFTLSALKANVWAFSINVKNIDIWTSGASVELHKWTHLVGTFDGTMLRLFVDGFLQNEVDVESVVDLEITKREQVIAKTRQDICDLEEEAKGKCFKEVDKEMQQLFTTKDGKKMIKQGSQKLLDEHEFRLRLSKGATAALPTTVSTKDKAEKDKNKDGEPPSAATATVPVKRDLSKVNRSDFEPLAKKQMIREKFDARIVSVLAEFTEMRRRVNLKITKELEEQSNLDARELRIGCLSSPSRRDGKYFFHGRIAHVAYYNGKILTRDQVNAHYLLGVRDRAHASDDLFALASTRFARALEYAPNDPQTLEKFAENICASLKYDLDHQYAQEMYKKKVLCGLQPFLATENVHGIAVILKNLPREPVFSGLFVRCYRAVLALEPLYFQATESLACRLALRELARMPFAFFLGSRAANSLVNVATTSTGSEEEEEEAHVVVFADVILKVLVDFPSFYGDQLTQMGWLRDLRNPRAVVYFILMLEAGDDVRYIDLKDVATIDNSDMEIICKHNRFALGFALANCSLLGDLAIMKLALCCSQIEELDLSYCSLLTDLATVAIGKHCVRLKRLFLVHCHEISDLGVEAAVQANPRLEQLSLSYCERISERCMATIGGSSPNLRELELELCVQINSAALKILADALVNPGKLRKLNLAGCHRVADDGLVEIATKCTRLQNVNLRLCDKLTDLSLRVLTHNNLELEVLNLEEVCKATCKLFQFDQEHDGRGVVDKNLAKKLRQLDLTACASMTDLALGHLGHRAKNLQAITLSACPEISDQGLEWLLVKDMLDKSRCGAHVTRLDVSYCPQLTSAGIHKVVLHCGGGGSLVSLNLSGCIHLSDENVVQIIGACSKLVSLQLAFCRELTDIVLLEIASHLSLEELNLARCVKITDDGMRHLASQLTVLKKLNVSACKRLTDKSLLGILETCVLLEELDVTHCPNFSVELLARFKRRRVKVISGGVVEMLTEQQQLARKEEEEVDEGERETASGMNRHHRGGASGEEAVMEATKPTRKTRLPGSESPSLPPIHKRTGLNSTTSGSNTGSSSRNNGTTDR